MMTEKELKALLADMTLEEKVDQMNQVAAGMFSGDITAMGPMAAKLYPPEVLARTGSVLGGMGAEALKKLQKEQIEKQPHKIPMLFMLDVINGFKTVYRFHWDRAQALIRSFPGSVRLWQRRSGRERRSCDFCADDGPCP